MPSDPTSPGLGDIIGDGDVNALDPIIFLQNQHERFPAMPNPKAHLEEDSLIDRMDLFRSMQLWE